jgi:polyisoprenoid-binding protein YceI
MKQLKLLWTLLAAVCVLGLVRDAIAWEFKGTATFKAEGTVKAMAIDGGGIHLSGTATLLEDGKATAEILADVREIVTGQSLRDSHLRDKYLEVAKYPTARLSVGQFQPSTYPTDFCGNLTIKNETKKVCGVVTVANLGERKQIDATFPISLKDFPSFGTPRYLGVGVKDEISVRVFGEASPKK